MNAQSIVTRIGQISPKNRATILNLEFGQAVKIEGKGAKILANHFGKELYYEGILATKWKDVRHGLGYVIPLYEAPMPCF
jgi:hypothetical protein